LSAYHTTYQYHRQNEAQEEVEKFFKDFPYSSHRGTAKRIKERIYKQQGEGNANRGMPICWRIDCQPDLNHLASPLSFAGCLRSQIPVDVEVRGSVAKRYCTKNVFARELAGEATQNPPISKRFMIQCLIIKHYEYLEGKEK
jgi:hypothetical protein